MNKIKEIRIQNFKAFPHKEVFVLNGKNLLLFGENGAGKSSIYWALYTFLQSSQKDDAGVDKYFTDYDSRDENTFQSLLNIHSPHTSNDSFIQLIFNDSDVILSKNNGRNTRNPHITIANLASDFITYKLLYNFYGSTHKNSLDVWDVFRHDVLPFFSYNGKNYDQHYSDFYINKAKYPNGYYYPRNTHLYTDYQIKIQKFNENIELLLGQINNQANIFLKDYLDIDNLEIILQYTRKFAWDENKSRSFAKPKIKFHIKVLKNGVFEELHRPQSFLNEAILAQLSLAIRMGALFTRPAQSETKILVLDDLLISLDMDNRDKVLDILLQKTTKSGHPNRFDDFQILFFTHDKGLSYFVGEKIKQHGRTAEWLSQEIYYGFYEEKDASGNIINSYSKPILIEGDLDDLSKAERYLNITKDYSSAALCVRKALELILINKLPKELAFDKNQNPKQLHSLWSEFEKYCNVIRQPLSASIKNSYNQSRLMILNPQAHYNYLSLPVYREELKSAIKLAKDIEAFGLNKPMTLLSKSMRLEFKHPDVNFRLILELESDFEIAIIGDPTSVIYPKTRIISWNNDVCEFVNPQTSRQYGHGSITNKLALRKNLKEMIPYITGICDPLRFDNRTFIDNTSIKNSIWTLKEIFDKVGVNF